MWKTLGIAPTRDIKEIKKAYARLAKQYNPEEKPEEFRRIFDAYKAACIYAKSTEIHFSQNEHNENEDDKTKLILISRSEDHTMTNADENKDTSSDEAADTAQEYDFSTVDVRKNTGRNKTDEIKDTSSDEAAGASDTAQEYDFSNVDVRKNTGRNEADEIKDISSDETADTAQGYDFSAVNVRKNTGRNESVSEEKFDFGSIDPHFSELNGTDRTSNLRIYLIRRLKKIFDSRKEADINTWQSFFYDTYFDELVFDVDFRLQARDVFFQRHLPLLTAKLVAEKFGAGTQYVDEGYGRYTVIISDGRNNYYSHAVNNTVYRTPPKKKGRKEMMIKLIVAAAAIAVLWGPMIFLFVNDPESMTAHSHTETTASPGVITLPPYEEGDDIGKYLFEAAVAVAEEQNYEEDFLYERCKGKWLFDFGYIEFFDEHRARISFNGKTSDGTVFTEAASKGAVLYMYLSCENEDLNGMRLTAHIISREGTRLICTYPDGNEYTGFFEQEKE